MSDLPGPEGVALGPTPIPDEPELRGGSDLSEEMKLTGSVTIVVMSIVTVVVDGPALLLLDGLVLLSVEYATVMISVTVTVTTLGELYEPDDEGEIVEPPKNGDVVVEEDVDDEEVGVDTGGSS